MNDFITCALLRCDACGQLIELRTIGKFTFADRVATTCPNCGSVTVAVVTQSIFPIGPEGEEHEKAQETA